MIGHSKQREALAGLPYPASLLVGPRGVGKWLAAQEAATAPGFHCLEVREESDVAHLRDVLGWLQMRPLAGMKVALVDLDAVAASAHHAMLKTLEEPPDHARLVCVTSQMALPTIWSRCHVIRFSALSRDEVFEVLVSLGKVESVARELSLVSGSVAEALEAEEMLAVRMDVLTFISVLERHDRSSVWDVDEQWSREHTRLLWRWVLEVAAGAPRVFRRADLDQARALGSLFFRLAQEVRGSLDGRFSPAAVALGLWRS